MTESAVDDVIDALANEHRRQLLVELRADNPHGEIPTEDGNGVPADDLAIEMVHNHLPKLDGYGFVEWDRQTGTVYRGPDFEELWPVLELLVEEAAEAEPPAEEA